jgi:hypothetical protein
MMFRNVGRTHGELAMFPKRPMTRMAWQIFAMIAVVTVNRGETPHRVKAGLIKQESALHTSIGNRDVYLLRVTPRNGTAFDAIVEDEYPGYAEPLPLHRLTKDLTFSVKLVRTPYCDRPVGGDGQETTVRCFTIERGSLKMPKNAASELWWK